MNTGEAKGSASAAPARPRLLERVVETVRRKGLFEPGHRLLVAVSGGPDSVALLALLHELAPSWKLALSAAHFNYGLRGQESDEDAEFVADLCRRWRIELIARRLTIPVGGGSLQERARVARYQALEEIGQSLGANRIALGHTADDQAETVLMWMLRGAGMTGLGGMPPIRQGLFVRPLLDVPRADILAYLEARHLTYRVDSSNARAVYFRNRIRRELLPVIMRLAPRAVEAIGRLAEVLREDSLYLDHYSAEVLARLVTASAEGTVSVHRDGLLALPTALQRRIVRATISQINGMGKSPSFGAVNAVLERVVRGRSGTALAVRGAWVAREGDQIVFRPHGSPGLVVHGGRLGLQGDADETVEREVPIPSAIVWEATGQRIEVKWAEPVEVRTMLFEVHRDRAAVFDADRFTHRLRLRGWTPGDLFYPLGMRGQRKKLQDYFTDLKIPRAERRRIPLLVAPEGILWVVGYRPDHRFAAGSSAARVLVATVTGNDEREGES
ncbi:MAG TPA: tRNA lysidine(34) synthetase TilS [Nitrospiraceae bacterium]|jgi:tRNA(Ile)-lysidine synthase|nr:tRNA lysidine(34) synthetase TilS [Nitrospiraceae bacterium]